MSRPPRGDSGEGDGERRSDDAGTGGDRRTLTTGSEKEDTELRQYYT